MLQFPTLDSEHHFTAMLRIGVLASHQGTNFQAIVSACQQGRVQANVALLICNNSDAPVMVRARKSGVPTVHLSSLTHSSSDVLDESMHNHLADKNIDLVVLAGYMKKLGPRVLKAYSGRIINVHPSLLPRHGGPGFYGSRVHKAVIESGDSETGATVHLVNDDYDMGKALLQEKITVKVDDTPDSLAERLHPIEHKLLIEVIQQFAAGKR
ncbi:MAG: phosphoribosylglycinamide formyltransferase [Gammaproteobacteria bacterium]|nr:phosphoribosylglycinamide formyltransferase [Gammaproteobacteria bacterium]MBT4614983.1 phosphoribosylglycinamide formyltransferase [Gammaproteobacteria bacterium]MBT5197359.1 phosphoribosylglycinamide formyltransferase [Gammaproteobacteria bacterium]MBT5442009.1 phosphoribosylglycinamide formyltransferase [Gammaproteobacteria bacterium]MBT5792140.1 phosphoribosylglycinamide formyltransferase [Gammaproteobacteria bacterium]